MFGTEGGCVGAGRGSRAGHRLVPHTADVRIEAWAPTREGCVEQAVTAMVEGLAEVPGDRDHGVEVTFPVGAAADADLLVAVLDEVIYRMDITGEVPVWTRVTVRPGGGLDVRQKVVDLENVEVVGAAPKAVSLHDLVFTAGEAGWWCTVTVDV